MTDRHSIHISSIALLVFVFPVSCYSVYDCTQDGKYDLLHTKKNVLTVQLIDGTYILLHTYRYLLLFLRLQVLDSESMLIDMS